MVGQLSFHKNNNKIIIVNMKERVNNIYDHLCQHCSAGAFFLFPPPPPPQSVLCKNNANINKRQEQKRERERDNTPSYDLSVCT